MLLFKASAIYLDCYFRPGKREQGRFKRGDEGAKGRKRGVAKELGGAWGEQQGGISTQMGLSGGAKRRHLGQLEITYWLGLGEDICIYLYARERYAARDTN